MILSIARREVITAHVDDGIQDVVARMQYYNVGCVVVIQNEKPTGIVTDRDLVVRVLGAKGNGQDASDLKVGDVMTRAPQTIREDEAFDKAVAVMRSAGVRRLPVVDNRGKLRGLVTLDDVVETLCRNMGTVAGVIERQQKAPKRAASPKNKKEEFAIRG